MITNSSVKNWKASGAVFRVQQQVGAVVRLGGQKFLNYVGVLSYRALKAHTMYLERSSPVCPRYSPHLVSPMFPKVVMTTRISGTATISRATRSSRKVTKYTTTFSRSRVREIAVVFNS